MTATDAKAWWVLSTGGNSGAVIFGLPEGSPQEYRFFSGQRMRDHFPQDGSVRFSKKFRSQKKLFDSVTSLSSIPIVSGRIKRILESFSPNDCEFLPVTILDHKGGLASKDHFVLNLLRSEDIIDMERSNYKRDGYNPDQIDRLRKLYLQPHAVPADARVFRARTMMDCYFLHQSVVDAFTQEGITGLRLFPADGWDGNDM